MATMKTSLNRKDKVISENENRIKFLQEEKTSLNDQLIELRVKVSEPTSQNKSFLDNKNTLVTRNENLRQEYNDLMMRLNKVTAENNKLMKEIGELSDKYSDIKDSKLTSNSQIDMIKRRCDELSMINKEYENRVDALEVELSEARSMLQERTREADYKAY
ncbi:unnamed protein product [Ambrosiozyma monospora]|uniref:Unnamed protein product n=1 Tax=Ambrosiozyma monospora TaxID=43982 RepID=A0ACB5UBY3_AMBMO|nr:unnamed protein product [Ambrosiozyma monospora]